MMPPITPIDLYADPDEVGTMGAEALQWLLDQDVSIRAISSPWAVRAAHVLYEPTGLYRPNPCGEFAYIFGCIDSEGVADLVAWSPRAGRLASRLGIASSLGQRQAEQAWHDPTAKPVRVWRDPLKWLRAGRNGVVLVDLFGAGHLLADLNLIAEDADHARQLRGALKVRPPRITSSSQQRIAA